MVFQTSSPVTAEAFVNREQSLRALQASVDALATGASQWMAIVGPRRIGKSSLILELQRRNADRDVAFLVLDVLRYAPLSAEVFRLLALRAVDTYLGPELGISLELVATDVARYQAALVDSKAFARLAPELRQLVLALPAQSADTTVLPLWLDVPERLAQTLERPLIVAIDEFQELAGIRTKKGRLDALPMMRSVWQRHARVGYFISGSARTMLTDLVLQRHSPFFMHFRLLSLEPLSAADSVELLRSASPKSRRITKAVAERIVSLIGGHPFYLQIIGESMTRRPPPYDDAALKSVLQDVLFSRTGALAMYFENEFRRLVGQSSQLAAALEALADAPAALTALAKRMRATPASVAQYLARLEDAVTRTDDGAYTLSDPVFAMWLRWRQPGGGAVPMTLLGDEAEREVARHLARSGFELVYQSRGSRGAFDLLAMRRPRQLAVQVKRSALPLRVAKSEWNRMEGDAKRYGWPWLIAAYHPDTGVSLLDPALARRGKQVRLGEDAVIENVILWLEPA